MTQNAADRLAEAERLLRFDHDGRTSGCSACAFLSDDRPQAAVLPAGRDSGGADRAQADGEARDRPAAAANPGGDGCTQGHCNHLEHVIAALKRRRRRSAETQECGT